MSIFGGLVAVALIAAVVLILLNRPQGSEDVSDIAVAPPPDASIPTNGRVMGRKARRSTWWSGATINDQAVVTSPVR